jgi:hypothetical protein
MLLPGVAVIARTHPADAPELRRQRGSWCLPDVIGLIWLVTSYTRPRRGSGTPNRQTARERHICPIIPRRATARYRPPFFPRLYKGRVRIEQTIGKLKRFKVIALRCKKTAENHATLISFACGIILVKSLHTA